MADPAISPPRIDRPDIRTIAAFAGLSLGLCLMAELSPKSDQPVAVVAWPWREANEASLAVVRAGGAIGTAAAGGHIVVARGNAPEFIDGLYAHGAGLVFNARWLGGCAERVSDNTTRKNG